MRTRVRQQSTLRRYARTAGIAAALIGSLLWARAGLGQPQGPIQSLRVDMTNSRNGKPILPRSSLVPGESVRGYLRIRNTGSVPARVTLTAPKVRDWRGAGGAKLSSALRLQVVDVTRPPHMAVYRGFVGDRRDVNVGDFRVGESRRFRFRIYFPTHTNKSGRYLGARLRVNYRWTANIAAVPGAGDGDGDADDISALERWIRGRD